MALHFELVTPSKLVRSEDVHMVVVPGTEGDFGVLEGHACGAVPQVATEDHDVPAHLLGTTQSKHMHWS